MNTFLLCISLMTWQTTAFTFMSKNVAPSSILPTPFTTSTQLFEGSSDVDEAAPSISGEELEVMMADFEQPLVVDAYATWCGPCLMMAPEFEAAAQELKGKVRMVKLDTDKNPEMANRLNIMGLPTLLFLDKVPDSQNEDGKGPKAVLKDRIEGALNKDMILKCCDYLFFDGPLPTQE